MSYTLLEDERNGYRICVTVEHDESMGEPWVEHDGHGIVREVHARYREDLNKNPGERVLHRGNMTFWLYDWAGTMALAKRDGWGATTGAHRPIGLTVNEIRAKAVDEDFHHLRRWLDDEWHWCGVCVQVFDERDAIVGQASLWGIESDAGDYLNEVAEDLIAECLPPAIPRQWCEYFEEIA